MILRSSLWPTPCPVQHRFYWPVPPCARQGEEWGRGILERHPEDKAKELVKNDDWNDFVITAEGKHVTIDFNGTRIIDRTDEKFADEGVIALQVHVGPPMEVRFKNIEITELGN